MYEHDHADASAPRRHSRAPTRERAGQAVDTYRLVSVLRNGIKPILIVTAVGLLLGYVIPKFLMPRTWLSRAVLVYEGVTTRTDSGEELVTADPRDLRTMVDSVKIPANLRQVQKRLGVEGPLDLFARRIDVTFDLESNLVEIWGRDETSEGAIEIANTMVEVFLEHRKKVDRERLRTAVDSIEKNLRLAQESAKEAHDRYDAFRREKGISDLTQERQQSIKSTADLQAKADMAGARAKELDSRVKSLETSGAPKDPNPAPVLPPTAAEKEQFQRARAELDEALTKYTREHPTVQALESRVRALEAKMTGANGAGRSLGRLRQERDLAASEERALRAQLDQLRGSLAKFSSAEGEAANLLAAVEVAEARAKSLRQELGRAEAKARAPTTGFRIESPASRPDNPEQSSARIVTALAIPIVFFLAAFGFLLWRELGSLRVCTPAEVAYWGKGPVIGSTTWPRDPDALTDLLAEMDDYMLEATGRTLVVPATERELDLVKAISDRFTQGDWSPDQIFVTSVEVLPPPITVGDGHSAPPAHALAKTQTTALAQATDEQFSLTAEAWTGPDGGPALRRAARKADRVLVVVRASETSVPELAEVPGRLGREDGIGYLVVGLKDEFTKLPDRAGPVSRFWRTFRDGSSS